MHGLPPNLAINSFRPFDALLALRPLEANLPLRAFRTHTRLLPLGPNLALRTLHSHTLGPFCPRLALRPFGPLAAPTTSR